MPTRLAAELLAEESFPGFGERFMWYDAFQTRVSANWLITEAEGSWPWDASPTTPPLYWEMSAGGRFHRLPGSSVTPLPCRTGASPYAAAVS